jgi:hypothetical protein
MRRILSTCAFTLGTLVALAPAARADVIVRGPFGGRIVVTSPDDVRVGPGSVVVVPAPPPAVMVVPAPQPVPPPPQPILPAPVLPQDFIKTFQPKAGHYEVTFLHTRSNQPVTVAFDLPPGNPRMSYFAHSLVFDYGRREVEIRFQIGGRVKVSER